MTNIHIVDPEPLANEVIVEKSLRPSFFDEFIGQKKLVENLKSEISRQRECITNLRKPSNALKEVE